MNNGLPPCRLWAGSPREPEKIPHPPLPLSCGFHVTFRHWTEWWPMIELHRSPLAVVLLGTILLRGSQLCHTLPCSMHVGFCMCCNLSIAYSHCICIQQMVYAQQTTAQLLMPQSCQQSWHSGWSGLWRHTVTVAQGGPALFSVHEHGPTWACLMILCKKASPFVCNIEHAC